MRPPAAAGTLAAMNPQHLRQPRDVTHPIPPGTSLEPRRRPRLRGTALVMAGILVAGLAVVACGGSSTPGVATGSPAAAVSPSADGSTGLLAYSTCMRSHGVPNFPDPDSSGGIPKETGQQLGVGLSQLQAAQNACQHLIPPGESLGGQPIQTITAQQQQYYLKAAACMRSHGVPSFPEPVFQNGQVEFPELSHLVDLNSPQFTQAYHVCQKLIPPGLPDSGSGAGSGS
jgi:hypothetical protein